MDFVFLSFFKSNALIKMFWIHEGCTWSLQSSNVLAKLWIWKFCINTLAKIILVFSNVGECMPGLNLCAWSVSPFATYKIYCNIFACPCKFVIDLSLSSPKENFYTIDYIKIIGQIAPLSERKCWTTYCQNSASGRLFSIFIPPQVQQQSRLNGLVFSEKVSWLVLCHLSKFL